MLFNSVEFVFFLLAVLFVYHALPLSWSAKKTFLLFASYLFYMAWKPPYGALLLASTIIDFYIANQIHRAERQATRRSWMILSCLVGLGILGFFKYSKFFLANWMLVSPWPGQMPVFFEDIVLPAGVSFYTFQSMSYTIDVYRREREPMPSFRDFALFVSFFPQLVAGPIIRASDFLPQLDSPRRTTPEGITAGLDQMARGFAKKVLFADTLSQYVDQVYAAPTEYSSINLLLAAYAYTFQIYFDFSGYSDIALGCARLMGFELPRNFDLPYLAANPADFWRRWHISLSTWLRDYLYISLGGSHDNKWKTYRNLFLTMLLGGLWHGAAWGFVIWGAYHGLLLVVHRYFYRDHRLPGLPRPLAIFVMFHLVCLGLIAFRAHTVGDLWIVLSRLTAFDSRYIPVDISVLLVLALSMPMHVCGASATLKRLWEEGWLLPRVAYYSTVILALVATAHGATPFIYFQF